MATNPDLKRFYNSPQWKKISKAYMQSKNYVCERCGGVGVICHHRQHLTPLTVSDMSISLSFKNLECLCMTCHNHEHFAHADCVCVRECVFDDNGNLVSVYETNSPANSRALYVSQDRRGPRKTPL